MAPEITSRAPYQSTIVTEPSDRKMIAAVRKARAPVRLAAAAKAVAVASRNALIAAASWTKDWTAVTATRRSWAKAAEWASVS